MRATKIKRILASLALSASFSCVLAQNQAAVKPEAKAQADKKQQAKPQAKPAAKEEAKAEEETSSSMNHLTLGVLGWKVGGNKQRFDQYASPINGLAVEDLSLYSQAEGENPWSHGMFRGNAQEYVGAGSFAFDHGKAWAGGFADRFNYNDPTVMPTNPSEDHRGQVETWYKLRPDLGIFASYRAIARDRQFEPPLPNYDYGTHRYAVGLQGTVLTGNGGVSYDGNTFNDHTGAQSDWTRNRIQAFWGRDFTSRIAAEGNYSRVNISQSGFADSKVEAYGADLSFDVTPTSTLFFNFRQQNINLPNVQNAYVQRRVNSSARLEGKLGRERLELGFRHTEEKRLDVDDAFVDIPIWNTWDLRLSGKLLKNSRYVAKLNWEHFNKGTINDLTDPLSLYWDDRIRAQARVDGGGDRYTWYASQGFGLNRNATRDVLIRSFNSTIGGAYSVAPTSTALLELSSDSYFVQGASDPNGLSLSQFFPNDISIMAGFEKTLTPRSTVLVNVNHTFTNYENPMLLPSGNTRTTQLTAQYRRQLAKDSSFGLTLAPWAWQDKLHDQYSYRATLFGVNYSKKF